MTFARGRLISYINIYHLFADPAVYHTFSLQFFGRLELRIWRWNMIDSEMEMKEQKSLVILTTKDRWSELPTYVTDYVQPEESSRWKSINTHTHTHTHRHTHTQRHTHVCSTQPKLYLNIIRAGKKTYARSSR